MEIFGFYKELNNQEFIKLDSFSTIADTKSNSIVVVDFNQAELMEYKKYHQILAIKILNVVEFLIVMNLKGKKPPFSYFKLLDLSK